MKSLRKITIFVALMLIPALSYAKPDPIDVEFGPWVTNVTETSFTVLWTTKTDNLGWVEVTPSLKGAWGKVESRRFYQEFAGRWTFGRMHSVTVTGLEKGTTYRYRVCGKKVVDDSLEQDLVYGIDKFHTDCRITTFDNSKEVCRFSVVNDIHLELDTFSTLMNQVNADSTDFILLNGDITSAGNYELDTLIRYDIESLGSLKKKIPVMFARGNHEGRGNNWMASYQVFPTRTPGQFYYTFRQGPVAFVVLDSGETKPPVSISYVGTPAYEAYLEKELEWLKQAVRDPEFTGAAAQVCIIHVPMTGKGDDASQFDAQEWMCANFIPVLNEAGVDYMLNAHTHKYKVNEVGSYGNDFPMETNGRGERLEFECDGKTIRTRVFNTAGEETHSFEVAVPQR